MIGSVVKEGSFISIYDENGRQIRCMPSDSNAQVLGYTGSTFSVKEGAFISIYDENGRQLSCRPC